MGRSDTCEKSGIQNPEILIHILQKIDSLPGMGPYGSIWAHIKTGRSHMAQDHFRTPPDPTKGCKKRRFAEKEIRRFSFEPASLPKENRPENQRKIQKSYFFENVATPEATPTNRQGLEMKENILKP